MIRKPSYTSIVFSSGWAIICFLIITKGAAAMAAQGKPIPHAVILVYSFCLFLIGFLPAIFIYWLGSRIWGPGYLRRIIAYIFETKDPARKALKRPFLVLIALAVATLVFVWVGLFLSNVAGFNVLNWLTPATIGIFTCVKLKNKRVAAKVDVPKKP